MCMLVIKKKMFSPFVAESIIKQMLQIYRRNRSDERKARKQNIRKEKKRDKKKDGEEGKHERKEGL